MNFSLNTLLILFVASIGVDRVNFLPDGNFTLTPFLIISFLLIFFLILLKLEKINSNWFMNDKKLSLTLSMFILFILISIPFSQDIYFSFKRLILLIYIIFSTLLIFISFDKKDLYENIYKGSIVGSILFYIFNIMLVLTWLGNVNIDNTFINFEPHTLSYFIPRLGGFSEDVNRGGFVLILFTYIMLIYKNKIKLNSLFIVFNIFFLFCTLSRSSIVFFVVTSLIYTTYYASKDFKNRYIIYVLLLFSTFIISINYLSQLNIIDLPSVIDERISIEDKGHDSSSSIHFMLIEDAIENIGSSAKIFLIGNGHGTSYKLIDGYRMSGKKFANFHSQYLSVFVENGIFAFLSLLYLTFIYPLYSRGNVFLPLVLGLFAFNLFYQLTNEPAYWFTIFLFYFASKEKYKFNK